MSKHTIEKHGFTIIELLVVISIIATLMGLLLTSVNLAKSHAKKTQAKAMVYSLGLALKIYESDYGAYPADPPGGTNKSMLDLLLAATLNGPYLETKTRDIDAAGNLIDPWGSRYVYENNADGDFLPAGEHNETSFDIYSFGEDMNNDQGVYDIPNNKDDINNWD